jgi:hypothetical protein
MPTRSTRLLKKQNPHGLLHTPFPEGEAMLRLDLCIGQNTGLRSLFDMFSCIPFPHPHGQSAQVNVYEPTVSPNQAISSKACHR